MPTQAIGKWLCLLTVGICSVSAAGEKQGHRFGEWPAISAVIAEEGQKNLNLGDKDFLIEIWFKPLATLKYKAGPNVLVSKKCADLLSGYTLCYVGDTVTLVLCDHRAELDRDFTFSARAGLKEGQWCYFAAGYSHRRVSSSAPARTANR